MISIRQFVRMAGVITALAAAGSVRAATITATPSELTVPEASVAAELLVLSLDAGSTVVATISASGDVRVSLSDAFASGLSETTANLSSTQSVTVYVFAASDPDGFDDLGETISISVTDVAVTNSPLVIAVAIIDKDPDPVYSISGRIASASNSTVGLSGVSIALTGDATQTAVSGPDGAFQFDVNPGWYSVTPFLSGRLFDPSRSDVEVTDADINGVVFLSTTSRTDDSGGGCESGVRRGRLDRKSVV